MLPTRRRISIVALRSLRSVRAVLVDALVAAAALQGVTDAAADPRGHHQAARPDRVLTPVLPSGGAGVTID